MCHCPYAFILDFNGEHFGKQVATGCSLSGHLVWTACQKIAECGFEAKEGKDVDLLDFVHVWFCSCFLQVKSKWRRKNRFSWIAEFCRWT